MRNVHRRLLDVRPLPSISISEVLREIRLRAETEATARARRIVVWTAISNPWFSPHHMQCLGLRAPFCCPSIASWRHGAPHPWLLPRPGSRRP